MATTTPAKVLLVEGAKDARLIPHLMGHHGVPWETGAGKQREFAVTIRPAGGLVQDANILSAELKGTGLRILGVIFDADAIEIGGPSRWAQMLGVCNQLKIDFPPSPEPGGYIAVAGNIRFGVWMMPDNKSAGMLETFLLGLLKENTPLLQHAKESSDKAKSHGANYKDVHRDKALVHTWLAWEDEPGAQLHEAIKWKILDPFSTNADGFVQWFKDLYEF